MNSRQFYNEDGYCSQCSSSGGDSDDAITNNDVELNDEEWEDIYDDSYQATDKMPQSRFKVSETVKTKALLSNESINNFLLLEKCGSGRKCDPCLHDGECAVQFGNIKDARESIRNLREKYWENVNEMKGAIGRRRQKLLDELESFKVVDKKSGNFSLQYKIAGIFVRKKFYWVSN